MKNKLKSASENNQMTLLSMLFAVGIYYLQLLKENYDFLPYLLYFHFYSCIALIMICIVALSFWLQSLGYILLVFSNDQNSKSLNKYIKSKRDLSLSIILIICSIMLFFYLKALVSPLI